jgi:hypothetical protein
MLIPHIWVLRAAWAIGAALVIALLLVRPAAGAEGASSNYFPGSYGNLLPAAAPEPGFLLLSQNFFYAADTSRTLLQGRLNTELEVDAFFTLLHGYYVYELEALDARFLVGGNLALGYSSLDAAISQPGQPALSDDSSRFGFGDMGLIPASIYWSAGPIQLSLYEFIIAPTGYYDVDDSVNIGRNYWSFDSVIAGTWFSEKTATDLSVVSGIMVNTENPETDYRSGSEFHLDFMANQFLAESLAVGFHGYYYHQFTGDSGSGAALGDFEGESLGLGAALFWIPKRAGGNLLVSGKWLRDLWADNRLEADYLILEIGWTF